MIRPSSFSTVSPADTSTSITSTSPSSPISGTATSIVSLLAAAGADSCLALSCCAGAESLELDEPEPATSSLITTVPSFTLSPVLMNTSFTVPACVDGTSIVALSVSSVINPSSFSMVSPTETNTSITSTSPSSPISGTATSMTSLPPEAAGAASDLLSSFGASVFESSEDASLDASEPPAAFISPITSPSLILSPTDTDKLTISPSNGAGMSIDALSLSTVTTPSSASMLSPTATHSSITSTSSPPTSGTIIF